MATGYPFKKYNFNVLIDGKAVGYFSEVSAPEMADEPIEYRAGDHQAGTPVKMPGLKKYGNATLRWGTSVSRYLTCTLCKKDFITGAVSCSVYRGKIYWIYMERNSDSCTA